MSSLIKSDHILAISESARNDLLAFIKRKFGNKSISRSWDQTLTLPAENFSVPSVVDIKAACKHENFLLSVGTIAPHKNQLGLVRAFDAYCKQYPDTNWSLVLIGHIHPSVYSDLRIFLKKNKHIKYEGTPDDETLQVWYRRCAFSVFPSVDEGFGLPIVESLWFGKPCICANFGAMGETGSLPGCVRIDTRIQSEIQAALTELIENRHKLERLCRDAISADLETWDNYAGKFIEKLEAFNQSILPLNNQRIQL